jgi:hypothetical protein
MLPQNEPPPAALPARPYSSLVTRHGPSRLPLSKNTRSGNPNGGCCLFKYLRTISDVMSGSILFTQLVSDAIMVSPIVLSDLQTEVSMKYDLTKIVDEAITSFEEDHPSFELTESARSMLANHADRKKKMVLIQLKEGKTTSKNLANGLKQMLAYAATLSEQPRVVKLAKKSYAGVFVSGRTVRPARTVPPVGSVQITSPIVREAMNKKCKTFPWC